MCQEALVLVIWGFVFASLYGHPTFAHLTLTLTLVVYTISKVIMETKNNGLKKLLLYMGMTVSLGTLACFKYPMLKSELPLMLQVKALGISYFTFKFLHVLIDTYRGRIKNLTC